MRLYSLVNNAGISIEALKPAVLHLTDESTWDITMRVNSKSVFLGCKYALTQMLSQEPHSSGDRGWIINISSIMGMIAGPENRKLAHIFHVSRDTNAKRRLIAFSFLLRFERCRKPAYKADCS